MADEQTEEDLRRAEAPIDMGRFGKAQRLLSEVVRESRTMRMRCAISGTASRDRFDEAREAFQQVRCASPGPQHEPAAAHPGA